MNCRAPRAAAEAAGQQPVELSERQIDVGDRVAIGTMHLAKGLEFKAVAVMACDDEVLPSAERIDSVVEESDLDDVYETELHLLYVACTRARDRLLVSGIKPGSEFLADLGWEPVYFAGWLGQVCARVSSIWSHS